MMNRADGVPLASTLVGEFIMLSRLVPALALAALCSAVLAQPAHRLKAAAPPERGSIFISNDSCATPTPIGCGQTRPADTTFATTDPNDPNFSCRLFGVGPGAGSVWFTFTALSTTATFETGYDGPSPLPNGTRPDTILAVYTGTCDNLVEVACNDDISDQNFLSSVTLTDLVVGQLYIIEVAAWTPDTVALYNLTVTSTCVAANDECSGAFDINCGETRVAQCSVATTNPSDPNFDCRVDFSCNEGGDPSQGAASVWFKFVATRSYAKISTAGGDTLLALYAGVCGELTQIACNDDENCSFGFVNSQLTVSDLTIGETYYIEVAAWNAESIRDFELTLVCVAPNDACSRPQSVGCGETVRVDLAGGTTSPDDPVFQCRSSFACEPGAEPGQGANSLWFQFVAPSTRAIVQVDPLIPGSGSDTLLQAFGPAADCTSLVPIACNDDIDCPNFNVASRLVLDDLVIGEIYLIELALWSSAAPDTQYDLRIDCLCGPAPECTPGSISEPEICGEDINSGCFQNSIDTTPINLGDVVCGSAPAGQTGDFDVYSFTVTQPTLVRISYASPLAGSVALLCPGCPGSLVASTQEVCSQKVIQFYMVPGEYLAGIANSNSARCDDARYLLSPHPVPACPGDANADGIVSFVDITTVLANFGSSYLPFPATGFGDANTDGVVAFLDITTVLANFGAQCDVGTILRCQDITPRDDAASGPFAR
jgi:hypothetical protein